MLDERYAKAAFTSANHVPKLTYPYTYDGVAYYRNSNRSRDLALSYRHHYPLTVQDYFIPFHHIYLANATNLLAAANISEYVEHRTHQKTYTT